MHNLPRALVVLASCLSVSAMAADPLGDRDARITRIVRAGGQFEFDNKKPSKPPIKLTFRDIEKLPDPINADIQKLETIRTIHIESLVPSDSNLEWAASLPNLVELRCKGGFRFRNEKQISPNGTKHLASSSKLEILDLSKNKLTDDHVAILGKLTRLSELNLAQNEISDDGLKVLKECRSLRVLNVENTNVTGSGFKDLKVLPKLEYLALGGNQIDDTSIASLVGCTEITALSLRSVAITDVGLRHIEKMDGLKRLLISGSSSLTKDGLRALSKKRPRLSIE